MTLTDARGLPVSANRRRSLEGYEHALTLLHGYFGDPLAVIDAVLAEDPQFVLGHALRAGMLITASDRTVEPLLKESVEAAESLSDAANDREKRHIAAARAWLDGDFGRSSKTYGSIVIDYPRDSLALQIAHIEDFLLGQSTMLRDRVARVLPAWSKDDDSYGYLLGMHAFGLEESNLYEQAEEQGRRALQINPRDPWAVHAVAHVMEMQGRKEEGIAWLTTRENDWAPDNMFAIHNWWHLALFHLDLDDLDAVLALYDDHIRNSKSGMALDLIDASALLWRLHLRDVDVGQRWQELSEAWKVREADGHYVFNDVHALMAYLGAGDREAVQALMETMQAAATASNTNAMMTRDVGLPIAHGLIAYQDEQYGGAISHLLDMPVIAHRFGGSHAQRDIIDLTLIEAALRGGEKNLANALAAQRLTQKPMGNGNRRLWRRAKAM
ncbi:tetratricopeptide repeat protein [Parapusillimonas sp. SGNA-6]|nr:tetratricopeptide repeat protein [Parapusillimonas sp. SGNA-6]